MFIKRVGEHVRIKPIGAHSWFIKNPKDWFSLKKGSEIEIPDNEVKSIFELYGNSIIEVKQKIEKEKKKEVK